MKKDLPKIFISCFPLYHGIAFLKHILASFYDNTISINKKIKVTNLLQEDKEAVFDKQDSGFMFDKVYIFIPEDEFYKKITRKSSGWRLEESYLADEMYRKNNLTEIIKEVINKKLTLQEEFDYIASNYPELYAIWQKLSWRNVHHYLPNQQIWWFKEISNFPEDYKKRVEFIKVTSKEITDFFDYKIVAETIYKKTKPIFRRHKDAQYIINTGLSSQQIAVSWYVIGNSGHLPANSKFIESLDIKNSRPNNRFQKFFIREHPYNLLSNLEQNISIFTYRPTTRKEEIVKLKFETFLNQGFSILILGERGTGKSHIVNYFAERQNIKLIPVNCSSFIDSHIAESELFGYKKGAFTDAKQDKDGLIKQAEGGILFMDEIHTLPKDVQFKLMRAFSTDQENRMKIRRIGDTKEQEVKVKVLIFATNRSIEELKEVLLPDFFDRIAQLIVEIPPLRQNRPRIRNAFKEVWDQLRFNEFYSYEEFPGKDESLLKWMENLSLYGNYRDLQRIAINYKTFLDFPPKLKKLLSEKTAFEYTKKQFEDIMHSQQANGCSYFSANKTPEQMLKEFRKDLADWAIKHFGSAKKAVRHFSSLGYKITEVTLYNWRNKISRSSEHKDGRGG